MWPSRLRFRHSPTRNGSSCVGGLGNSSRCPHTDTGRLRNPAPAPSAGHLGASSGGSIAMSFLNSRPVRFGDTVEHGGCYGRHPDQPDRRQQQRPALIERTGERRVDEQLHRSPAGQDRSPRRW